MVVPTAPIPATTAKSAGTAMHFSKTAILPSTAEFSHERATTSTYAGTVSFNAPVVPIHATAVPIQQQQFPIIQQQPQF
jgi:hypothetical protein